MKYKNILVTGGCGFIGSHFIRYLLKKYPKIKVVNLDLLTYAGNPKNLSDIAKNRHYKFYKGDIGNYKRVDNILKKEGIDCIVNFAAESDNNKALHSPMDFAKTNVLGTTVLLETARKNNIKRFHHISTCEVFGELELNEKNAFIESDPYQPKTPYNASKAGGDLMAKSYQKTFNLPLTISYCANNYGTHQFPEKVVPVFILKALHNQPLPLFKSSNYKREWIHVLDHCEAIDLILQKGVVGQTYNIGTGFERSIKELADDILHFMNKPKDLTHIIPDRLGHDKRYLLNPSKIEKLGWKSKVTWEKGLLETVQWYKKNKSWWQPLLTKSHAWK